MIKHSGPAAAAAAETLLRFITDGLPWEDSADEPFVNT